MMIRVPAAAGIAGIRGIAAGIRFGDTRSVLTCTYGPVAGIAGIAGVPDAYYVQPTSLTAACISRFLHAEQFDYPLRVTSIGIPAIPAIPAPSVKRAGQPPVSVRGLICGIPAAIPANDQGIPATTKPR